MKMLQTYIAVFKTFTKLCFSLSCLVLQDNRVHIGPKMEMRVVTLGLEDSGKTSIVLQLKQNEFIQTIPTIGDYFKINTTPLLR